MQLASGQLLAQATPNDEAASSPRDVVLYVVHAGGSDDSRREHQLTERILGRLFPRHRVATVHLPARSWLFRTLRPNAVVPSEAERAATVQAMRDALEPHEWISHLIVDTHGQMVEHDGELRTDLLQVGRLFSGEISPSVEDVFGPVKGRLRRNAVVVLDACSTMCGPENEAAERARGLLAYLGADVLPRSRLLDPNELDPRLRRDNFVGDLRRAGYASFFAGSFGLLASAALAAVGFQLEHSHVALPGTFAALAAVEGMRRFRSGPDAYRERVRRGWFNLGRLFRFRSGRLTQTEDVVYLPENYPSIFAAPTLSCDAYFAGAGSARSR